MEGFIYVKATPCNSKGDITKNPASPPRQTGVIELNIDLITAIDGKRILLKSNSDILKVGGEHYTNLQKPDLKEVKLVDRLIP